MPADVDLDVFSAQVTAPQGTWRKARVLVADGAAHVFVPDTDGSPRAVLSRRAEALTSVAGRWYVDVAGEGGVERWEVAGPCGCASSAKRWATAALVARAPAVTAG